MAADNNTTTRLLTLLNVSATKAGKRKWADYVPAEKLNKRKTKTVKTVSITEQANETPQVSREDKDEMDVDEEAQETKEIEEDTVEGVSSEHQFSVTGRIEYLKKLLFIRFHRPIRIAFWLQPFLSVRSFEKCCRQSPLEAFQIVKRKTRSYIRVFARKR